MKKRKLNFAFQTGYTDEQYQEALKEFFAAKEAYDKGWELIDYEDSIFYFKKEKENGKSNTKTS